MKDREKKNGKIVLFSTFSPQFYNGSTLEQTENILIEEKLPDGHLKGRKWTFKFGPQNVEIEQRRHQNRFGIGRVSWHQNNNSEKQTSKGNKPAYWTIKVEEFQQYLNYSFSTPNLYCIKLNTISDTYSLKLNQRHCLNLYRFNHINGEQFQIYDSIENNLKLRDSYYDTVLGSNDCKLDIKSHFNTRLHKLSRNYQFVETSFIYTGEIQKVLEGLKVLRYNELKDKVHYEHILSTLRFVEGIIFSTFTLFTTQISQFIVSGLYRYLQRKGASRVYFKGWIFQCGLQTKNHFDTGQARCFGSSLGSTKSSTTTLSIPDKTRPRWGRLEWGS